MGSMDCNVLMCSTIYLHEHNSFHITHNWLKSSFAATCIFDWELSSSGGGLYRMKAVVVKENDTIFPMMRRMKKFLLISELLYIQQEPVSSQFFCHTIQDWSSRMPKARGPGILPTRNNHLTWMV